jgi:hypothetical protein
MAALLIAAAGLGALGAASPASAGTAPSSTAYGISAVMQSQGTLTQIPPVARVAGNGLKAYTHTTSQPLFSESLGVVSASNMVGSLAVVTSGITSHVSGTGTAGATVQAEADGSTASVDVTLSLVPPPGSTQPPAAPLLSLSATDVTSQVTDTRTLPSVGQQAGTASFGTLSLSGSMVGSQTLTFSGAAPANTVLYSDPNMTVTLNEQTVSGVIDCSPICQFVPKMMIGDALIVQMFQKPAIGNASLTGELVVGQNVAGVP